MTGNVGIDSVVRVILICSLLWRLYLISICFKYKRRKENRLKSLSVNWFHCEWADNCSAVIRAHSSLFNPTIPCLPFCEIHSVLEALPEKQFYSRWNKISASSWSLTVCVHVILWRVMWYEIVEKRFHFFRKTHFFKSVFWFLLYNILYNLFLLKREFIYLGTSLLNRDICLNLIRFSFIQFDCLGML